MRPSSLSSVLAVRLYQNWSGQVDLAAEEPTRMVRELEWLAVEEAVVEERWTEVDELE